MGFFRELLKIVAALVGLPLTLAGLLGALFGFVIVFLAISGEEEDFAMGVVLLLGGIVSLTIGTILGKFARGDYD
jgi:drug/metabolite transporter (DMT)-like permease